MPSVDGIDISVLADRVAGQPGFDQAIKQFVTGNGTSKLASCVVASCLDLMEADIAQEESERISQEGKDNGEA